MDCNFYAAMHHSDRNFLPLSTPRRSPPPAIPGAQRLLAALGLALAASLLPPAASAQPAAATSKAERDQALTFDAGQVRIDGKRKLRVLSGGVELRRGDFVLKASEVEVRDGPQGALASALSAPGQVASFRQKREGFDETVEGQADRIDYDAAAGTVRLVGKAVLKRLRGSTVSEEVSGQTIVYDHERETFEVQGGAAGSGGRVKGTVTPLGSTRAAGGEGR